jgi:hypothetical protein
MSPKAGGEGVAGSQPMRKKTVRRSPNKLWKSDSILHLCQRHRYRRPSTTNWPGCWAMGTNKVKKCAVRKIIFCTKPPRQDKNLFYLHDEPEELTKEGPFSYVLCTHKPLLPQFQQSGAPPFSSLSERNSQRGQRIAQVRLTCSVFKRIG